MLLYCYVSKLELGIMGNSYLFLTKEEKGILTGPVIPDLGKWEIFESLRLTYLYSEFLSKSKNPKDKNTKTQKHN